jgi:hypothetical protein
LWLLVVAQVVAYITAVAAALVALEHQRGHLGEAHLLKVH